MNSIKRLDSVHQTLIDTIATVSPQVLNVKPAESQWCVAEVVNHLCLVEEQVLLGLQKSVAGPPVKLPPWKKLIPMRIVSWRLFRVKAPKLVRPSEQIDLGSSLKNWEELRTRFKAFCADQGSERLSQVALPHPVFGKIDGNAAVSMLAFHELRHYKQIKEILRSV